MRIGFRVEGDARFLSHHDMMRCMELAAGRAKVPMRFSEGFNPRPKMSLPLPRPVGVAALDEVLVITLADEDVEPAEVFERIASQTPDGVTVTNWALLPGRKPPQAVEARYAAPVDAEEVEDLRKRIDELDRRDTWDRLRIGGKGKPDHQLDLRTLIRAITFDGETLHFTLAPNEQLWARVPEVLDLLNLDPVAYRARVVRTDVVWAPTPDDIGAHSAVME